MAQSTITNIQKEDRLCIKSTAPGALCAKGAFQMQPLIYVVNFSNKVLVPHIT